MMRRLGPNQSHAAKGAWSGHVLLDSCSVARLPWVALLALFACDAGSEGGFGGGEDPAAEIETDGVLYYLGESQRFEADGRPLGDPEVVGLMRMLDPVSGTIDETLWQTFYDDLWEETRHLWVLEDDTLEGELEAIYGKAPVEGLVEGKPWAWVRWEIYGVFEEGTYEGYTTFLETQLDDGALITTRSVFDGSRQMWLSSEEVWPVSEADWSAALTAAGESADSTESG